MAGQQTNGEVRDRLAGLVRLLSVRPESADPWAESVNRGSFAEALPAIEEWLTADPNSLSAKLWWILAQLQLDNVPVAALSSPLEELFDRLKSAPENAALACAAYTGVAYRLYERNQLRLCVAVFDRSVQLAALSGALSAGVRHELIATLVQLIESELERAQLRREGREYVEGLKSRLESLREESRRIPKTAPAASPQNIASENGNGKARARVKPISAKSILARELDFADLEADESAPDISPDSPGPKAENPSRRRAVFGVGAIVVMICLLNFAFRSTPEPEDDFAESRTVIQTDVASRLAFLPPQTPMKGAPARASADGHLDRISERLKKIDDSLSNSESRLQSQNSGAAPASDASEKKQEDSEIDKAALTAAQSSFPADTATNSGVEAFGNPGVVAGNALDPAKTPELDPNRVAANPVDLGVVSRKTSVDGLRLDPNGRVFGPPVPPTAPVKDPSGKGYVRAYEVEQFPSPLRYRTIASTKVFSAPSMTAATLIELQRNSNIQVVAKMGIWLELRSTSGKRGYVYAQDAERVGD